MPLLYKTSLNAWFINDVLIMSKFLQTLYHKNIKLMILFCLVKFWTTITQSSYCNEVSSTSVKTVVFSFCKSISGSPESHNFNPASKTVNQFESWGSLCSSLHTAEQSNRHKCGKKHFLLLTSREIYWFTSIELLSFLAVKYFRHQI